VALKGPNHDGHRFVGDALRAGATVVVVERLQPEWRAVGPSAFVVVEDTADALFALAAWHRSRLRGAVVAVTGSCGKSTVKEMIAAILARHGSCSSAPGSFNNRVGVPLSLLAACEEDDYVVLELGANAPGEIEELARCARPRVGVITCIGECHLEGFGSMEGVRDAKAELVAHLPRDGTLVLNADDVLCMSTADGFGGELSTFGFSPRAGVHPVGLIRRDGCWLFRAAQGRFRLPLPGRCNVLNAAAALAASLALGAEPQEAAAALAGFTLPPLRLAKRTIGGVTFVEDCYNSNPTAMRAALEAFMDEPISGRRVVVCGDMLELGEEARELHRRMGRHLARQDVQMLVAVGRFGRDLLEGWNSLASSARQAMRFKDAGAAWLPLWNALRAGDGVLVKGSRAMGLERITEYVRRYVDERHREAAA